MIYGYCRVSTPRQRIERQEQNIKELYPGCEIYRDFYTGTSMERPAWRKLLERVQPGDTIVFDEVSRMSRTSAEGYQEYQKLYAAGVELRFLKESYLNTAVFRAAQSQAIPKTGTDVDVILSGVNQYLLLLAEKQIKLAFEQSQAEVDRLHQRTREGIAGARRAGKQIGRRPGSVVETAKAKAAKDVIRKHSRAFGGMLNDTECCKLAGCSRNSYYKYKRQIMLQP